MSETPAQNGGAASGPWTLAATILASSMVFVDSTVVGVALPAIQSSLQATIAGVQWVVESYALLLGALLLTGGSLGDLYGRRKIFAIGVFLFCNASIVGSSRVDLQACKLEYSIVSPK